MKLMISLVSLCWTLLAGPIETGAASPARGSDVMSNQAVSAQSALFENPRDSSSLRVDHGLFVRPNLSVGEATPLNPDPTKSWQAVHAKLWFDLRTSRVASKLFLQSGVGFSQADQLFLSQNLWTTPSLLMPLGVGMDYPFESGHGVTTMFSLNLSDIRAGAQPGAYLTPGLVFGFRF
jgi:hypothetical protein